METNLPIPNFHPATVDDHFANLKSIDDVIHRIMKRLVPLGTVLPYAGETIAPLFFLLCDGAAYDQHEYADLFAVIGTTYGGSGRQFNVPDLRGRVITGLDNMGGSDAGIISVANTLGAVGGSESHTLTTAELPAHNHGGATGVIDHVLASPRFGNWTGPGAQSGLAVEAIANGSEDYRLHTHSISSQGGGGSHANMPPYILLNYIIKF